MKKVFLGGTCNGSIWRDELIPMLKIDYFNPVVENWTVECQKEEIKQREICDYCLYVITPQMEGFYSIAEAIDDSNKRPEKILFCCLDTCNTSDLFTRAQLRSLYAVKDMIKNNGGKSFYDLVDVADFLNS